MTIGTLNELLQDIAYRVRFEGTDLVPTPTLEGNPLQGEALQYDWKTVRDEGITFDLAWEKLCFVDRVVLKTGEKTKLCEAVLKSPCGTLLSTHRAESGNSITTHEIALEAGAVTDSLSLCLRGNFSDIELLDITLYGAIEGGIDLFPTPAQHALGDKTLPLCALQSFSAEEGMALDAAAILCEKLSEACGISLKRVSENGFVRLLVDPAVKPDGYRLSVSDAGVEIAGANLRGLVMGVEALIKLSSREGVRIGTVNDAPFLPFRGVHLFLPSKKNMEFARRLIKYLISPMGYNVVILEVAGGMRFDSHPEINAAVENALEKARLGLWPKFPHGGVSEGTTLDHQSVRDYVAYIRSFGIEVIPEVQSLGHVPFMTIAHPEIAEVDDSLKEKAIDTRSEDSRPDLLYPHCYCPSNEASYALLFDLLDEIIEVFEPKEYVHMGHDEVYYMGLCPRCREKSHAELFASDVNRIYAHLKQKGLKMMIWSDMLQPVTKYQTPAAIDMIPKDILCLDFIWYFHLDKDIEDNLLEKGFRVAVGNLYSSHYPRYESRIRKPGMLGGQISTWVATTEPALQKEGKFYDLFMTAQMLWSDKYSRYLTLTYDRIISAQMPMLREQIKGICYPSRVQGATVQTLWSAAPTLPPVSYEAPAVCLEVQGTPNSLIFTHTLLRRLTRLPWAIPEEVGKYVLTYTDGTAEEIPLAVGKNIAHWNRRHNEILREKLYRHNGYTACYETDGVETKTPDGQNATLYRYEHLLPEGKTLATVKLEQSEEKVPCIFVAQIDAVTL